MPKKWNYWIKGYTYSFLKDANTFCKIDPAGLSHEVLSLPHFAQVGFTTTCRPVWEPGIVGEEGSCDWSPEGCSRASHQPGESLMFKDAYFCIYVAPTQKTILHLVLNHRIAICSDARETTGCVGLVRSTMSVSIVMCKYCVLDFIVDWKDFQRLFWFDDILTLNLTPLIPTWSMTAGSTHAPFSLHPCPINLEVWVYGRSILTKCPFRSTQFQLASLPSSHWS